MIKNKSKLQYKGILNESFKNKAMFYSNPTNLWCGKVKYHTTICYRAPQCYKLCIQLIYGWVSNLNEGKAHLIAVEVVVVMVKEMLNPFSICHFILHYILCTKHSTVLVELL